MIGRNKGGNGGTGKVEKGDLFVTVKKHKKMEGLCLRKAMQ